jgi:3-hydroxyisobutyrate dehydrogenase
MGGSMALNAIAGGHELVVHDVRKAAAARHVDAGARWAASVEDAGRGAKVVLTSLPGPKEVEAVSHALFETMSAGAAWFDLSTNSPTLVRRLHERFAQKVVAVLDAPVSGGPSGAKSRKLALWVGGERAVFDRCRPLLDAIGDQVLYVGGVGAGSVAKLVHNCAGYAMQLALAEVFTMGVKAGVEPLALWGAIRQGSAGRQRSFDRLGEQFLQGRFDPPNFALALGHKDMTLATELSREVGVPMRLANLAYAEMTDALNRGWGHRDARSYLLLQQERAGLDFKVPAAEIGAVLKRDG